MVRWPVSEDHGRDHLIAGEEAAGSAGDDPRAVSDTCPGAAVPSSPGDVGQDLSHGLPQRIPWWQDPLTACDGLTQQRHSVAESPHPVINVRQIRAPRRAANVSC